MPELHPLIEEIKTLRVKKRLTVTQLALRVSTSAGNVSHILQGDSLPSLRTLEELGDACGVELRWVRKRKVKVADEPADVG